MDRSSEWYPLESVKNRQNDWKVQFIGTIQSGSIEHRDQSIEECRC